MSFDLIAPVYDALSRVVFGRSLEQAQQVYIPRLSAGSTVLIVGGGTGSQLPAMLTQCRPARVLFLEASSQMLTRARQRVQHHGLIGRVEFRHGTEADLQNSDTFDAILLPFVLDLSTEPLLKSRFIPPLLQATKPGGYWLVTDFINSPKLPHRIILKTMYPFFRLVSGIRARQLPDWPRLLTEAGLTVVDQQVWAGGQVQTGIWVMPDGAAEEPVNSNSGA